MGPVDIEKSFETLVFREAHGGRSRFAAASDRVLTALFCAFGLYLAVRPRLVNRAACLFCTALVLAAGLAFAAYFGKRISLKTRARLIEEGKALARETKLSLDPEPIFARLRGRAGILLIERTELFTADDIRAVLSGMSGSGLKVVSPAKPTAGAEALMRAAGMDYLPASEALGGEYALFLPVSHAEAVSAALIKYRSKYEKKRRAGRLWALPRERAVKFFSVGAGLMLMSLIMRYSLYYRLAGSLALSLGAWFFAAERLKRDRLSEAR